MEWFGLGGRRKKDQKFSFRHNFDIFISYPRGDVK